MSFEIHLNLLNSIHDACRGQTNLERFRNILQQYKPFFTFFMERVRKFSLFFLFFASSHFFYFFVFCFF